MNRFLMGAAALAVAMPALAQTQPAPDAPPAPIAMPAPPRAPMPPTIDRSQTRDQMVAKVRDHFARMDTNRDGFVGTDEMQTMRGQHQQKMGTMGGRSGNHMAMRDPTAAFDRLDANRDGSISRDEFAKGHQIRIERKIVMNGAPGAMSDHRGMRMKMHRMGGQMGGRMMKMADLNRDGRVSLQEATTSALQHFDQVDTNRDGRITPDERRLMHQQRMEQRDRRAS